MRIRTCNIIVLAAAVAALVRPAPAAAGDGSPGFGLKAGLNVGSADYSPLPAGVANDTLAGFAGGFYARWKLSEKLYLQPEALYVTKGFTLKYSSGGMRLKTAYRLGYLDVPFFLGFVPGGESGKLRFFAGPVASLLLSAKATLEVSGSMFGSFSATADVKKAFKSGDLGLAGGIGYGFSRAFSAELRFERGAANISDVAGVNIKNSNLSLLLCAGF